MATAGNSGNTAGKGNRKPPPGKPFVKGDVRINRAGRPSSADFSAALREKHPDFIRHLFGLMEKGSEEAQRWALDRYCTLAYGTPGPTGYGPPEEGVQAGEASGPSAAMDLAPELRRARERLEELRRELESATPESLQVLRKAEAAALEQVRRLVATQSEVNPGGDARGDFTVTLQVEGGGVPGADEVPNCVAGEEVQAARIEDAPEAAAAAPTTGNPLVDGLPE